MSRSLGGVFVISRSPMKIFPLLTSSSPASIRRVVDLPQPEGPTRTMNSPSPISRLMPGTAGLSAPGYQRCASSNLTVAMREQLLHRQVRAGRSVVKVSALTVADRPDPPPTSPDSGDIHRGTGAIT